MDPKHFPESKVSIIVQRGLEEFSKFCRRIPRVELERCLRRVKVPGGFRGDQAISRQIQVVYRDLQQVAGKNSQLARSTLGNLWATWVSCEPRLHQPLLKFDNRADRDTAPNTELDIKCFEYLYEQSGPYKIDRGLISVFYQFGYFPPDARIEYLLEKFPPEFIEEKEEPLDHTSTETPQQTNSENSKVRVLKEQFVEIRNDVRKLTERAAALGVSLDSEKGRTSKNERALEQLKLRLKEQQDESVSAHQELLSSLQENNSSIQDLSERFGSLESRIEILEKRVSDLGAKVQSTRAPASEPLALSPIRTLTIPGKPRETKSIDDLLELLSNNYHACGLQGKPSMSLARDTIAALSVGQVPLFAGSFASELARAAAATFSKGNNQVFEVAVDSSHGGIFHTALSSFLDKSRHYGSFIIDGANRAPIEVYGASLLGLVRSNGIGSNSFKKAIFGILTPLPGGLPLTDQITELGPVFETDSFTWGNSLGDGELTIGEFSGVLSRSADVEIIPQIDENLDDCRRKIDRKSSVSWRSVLRDANQAVHAIPSLEEDLPLSGLLCGWIVPRAISTGHSAHEVQSIVAHHFGDEIAKSHRVRKTISLMAERWL